MDGRHWMIGIRSTASRLPSPVNHALPATPFIRHRVGNRTRRVVVWSCGGERMAGQLVTRNTGRGGRGTDAGGTGDGCRGNGERGRVGVVNRGTEGLRDSRVRYRGSGLIGVSVCRCVGVSVCRCVGVLLSGRRVLWFGNGLFCVWLCGWPSHDFLKHGGPVRRGCQDLPESRFLLP